MILKRKYFDKYNRTNYCFEMLTSFCFQVLFRFVLKKKLRFFQYCEEKEEENGGQNVIPRTVSSYSCSWSKSKFDSPLMPVINLSNLLLISYCKDRLQNCQHSESVKLSMSYFDHWDTGWLVVVTRWFKNDDNEDDLETVVTHFSNNVRRIYREEKSVKARKSKWLFRS